MLDQACKLQPGAKRAAASRYPVHSYG